MVGTVIRPFRRDDTEPVVALWRAAGLVVPWNDPYRDIERKLTVQPELFLAERGCPKLNLQVRSTNTGVIEWYRSLGYELDGAVSMGKRLIPDLDDTAT